MNQPQSLQVDVPRMLYLLRIYDASFKRNEWWARCPFPDHADTEPSWSIHDEYGADNHGHHKCFGCKKGGGPIDLVAARIGITRWGAARWIREQGLVLGDSHGTIEELSIQIENRMRKQASIPPTVRFAPFDEWPGLAKTYLERRRISPQYVLRYRLGYAVQGRLKGRIVLPSWDRNFRPTNYTARSFVNDPKRYLNPKKEDGFPNHSSIFGEHLWGDLPSDVVFVSEGAINALAIDAATEGKCAVGAVFGSRLHPQQVLKLSRFRTIIHVADPDITGIEFARVVRDAMRDRVKIIRLEDVDAADTPREILREKINEKTES